MPGAAPSAAATATTPNTFNVLPLTAAPLTDGTATPDGEPTAAVLSGALPPVDEISLLRTEIKYQQTIINNLQKQLTFVLSFLGITEQEARLSRCDESEHDAQTPAGQIGEIGVVKSNTLPSWAGMVELNQRIPEQQQQQLRRPAVSNFQQSIVAAVYVDQAERKRRESSLIVSGLAVSHSISDQTLFTDICRNELDIHVDAVVTKRLGRVQPGKIQPLLVVLRSSDQAQKVIAAAKQLRKSTNEMVRKQVYINRNLTRAEAEAAYQVRQKRRQTAMAHREDQHSEPTRQDVNQTVSVQSDVNTSLLQLNAAQNPTAVVQSLLASKIQMSAFNQAAPLSATATKSLPAGNQLQEQGRH
jgi:uncharacterized protein YdeI (BOF family)